VAVLDRLLEDDRLDIRAVTASSAGAMNAAALISGLHTGGAEGARARLDLLWREVNLSGGRNVFGDSSIWSAALTPGWLKETSLWRSAENAAMSMSPYQFNPFNLNPLKRVLDTAIDFEAVRASPIRLFVAATAVNQGRARLFENTEITDQVLLASACLPHLFHAVEIDGEPYWDGGYLANPALWPLFYADTLDDILLLPLNPFAREEAPRAAGEIMDRYRALLMHAIEPGPWLDALSLSSKFDTEWTFLNDLKARGRDAAGAWLDQCFAEVGVRSSVDIRARFLA
jgi:NTE family protein